MKRGCLVLGLLLCSNLAASQPAPAFRTLDVYVTTDVALAAWQLSVSIGGDGRVVGIEGAEGTPFADAPFYDPAALAHGRVIIAAFNTDASLAPGRHRVATLHVREVGDANYEIQVDAAGDPAGSRIAAQATLDLRNPAE